MRIKYIIIGIVLSSSVYAQNKHDPFVGGVEFGLGYSTFIDFNLDNNSFDSHFLLERIFDLPYQLGFVTAKYLNSNKYLEFGIIFAKRSTSYVEHYSVNGTANSAITLYCIDFPMKYYAFAGKMFKHHMFAYGGLIPSWLVEPVEYDSDDINIPEDCFRNLYFSVCGGLCFDKKKSRMKLHAGLAVTSIVNINYREIPLENRDYGGRIYPFELLFCYARMFR